MKNYFNNTYLVTITLNSSTVTANYKRACVQMVVFLFFIHLSNSGRVCLFFFYMDSPPSRSPGRNELRLEGVALAGSVLSMGVVPHKLAAGGLVGQPVFHVSAALLCLVEPRQAPVLALCWGANCCKRLFASDSAGDSAKIVVLPSTQLFKACWAWN